MFFGNFLGEKMAKEIYTEIFQFYHVLNKNDSTKRAMRKVIRTRMGTRDWDKLSDIEKREFKLVTMRDYLIEYTPKHKRAEVEKNIENELKATLLSAHKALKMHNDEVEELYKHFYDENASEEENLNAYKEFCDLLHKYFPTLPAPTYAEFKEQNPRLIDYYQTVNNNFAYSNNSQESHVNIVSQDKIDHYVLECVRKVLKDKLDITIDENSIRHCLEITQDIDLIENEHLPETTQNLEILDCNEKLKSLDYFIKSSKEKK